jgi:hypothetical protein
VWVQQGHGGVASHGVRRARGESRCSTHASRTAAACLHPPSALVCRILSPMPLSALQAFAYIVDNVQGSIGCVIDNAIAYNRQGCLQLLLEGGALHLAEGSLAAFVKSATTYWRTEPSLVVWLVEAVTADADAEGPPARRTRAQAQRQAAEQQRHMSTELFAAAALHGHLPLLKLLRWGGQAASGCQHVK